MNNMIKRGNLHTTALPSFAQLNLYAGHGVGKVGEPGVPDQEEGLDEEPAWQRHLHPWTSDRVKMNPGQGTRCSR